MEWICIQRGAREHYAIPRALHLEGKLKCLLTEFYASRPWNWILKKISCHSFKSLAGRCHPQLKGACVVSWNVMALLRALHQSEQNRYVYYLKENRWLMRRSLNWLRSTSCTLGSDSVVFSYSGTALDFFAWAKKNGVATVLGVIDPGRVEQDMVREEIALWPGWQEHSDEPPPEYNRHRDEECKLADVIIVNSHWSFEALVKQGVPEKKLQIIPLCYEVGNDDGESVLGQPVDSKSVQPFRVLFLGQVILRKGIQYLLRAAQHPDLTDVRFEVVGPLGISLDVIKAAPPNVRFHGSVSRVDVAKWYRQCHLFVLPTISDGFAITQIEAMAYGLPVIATPHCGDVVRNEMDGLIIPIRDAEALAQAILRFIRDGEFYERCRKNALARSKSFTLRHLQRHLITLEEKLKN